MESPIQTINKFKKLIDREGYIFQPFNYLKENYPNAYENNVDQYCISILLEHNCSIVEKMRKQYDELSNVIDVEDMNEDIEYNEDEQKKENSEYEEEKTEFKDYDEYVPMLLYAKDNNNLEAEINGLIQKQVPINSLKFAIFKRIKKLELELNSNVIYHSLDNNNLKE